MNRFRHFYFYAKGHYEHSDNPIHDLAVLCNDTSLISVKHWEECPYGIVHTLTTEVFRLMNTRIFDEFICDINPDGIKVAFYDPDKKRSLAETILVRFMCILSHTSIEDFPEDTWAEAL